MENMWRLIYRYIHIIILASIFSSCTGECLDLELIDGQTIVLESWITDNSITSKNVTSSIGISEVISVTHDGRAPSETIFDDCGQSSESFNYSTFYDFNNFPINLRTSFKKQGEEDGFTLNIDNFYRKQTTYYLTSGRSTNNSIELLNNYDLNGTIYDEIFRINLKATEDSDIKWVYLIKEIGVIQIELNNGIILFLD